MTKEETFKLILEEKVVIDALIWIVRIEEKVDKSYQEYIEAMTERHKHNSRMMKLIEQHKIYLQKGINQ